jgi:UDP-N-acetylglucosamine 2-epimerase (non-hydrolysing)
MPKPDYLVLIGTKAQFIKTAPILQEMDRRRICYRLVYTGQHSETFDLLESAFGTRPPDDVMVPDQEASTHMSFIRWCVAYWVAALSRVVGTSWKNSRIAIVHGDTASTLFGALAARCAGIPVAHIEAGLRSPNAMNPFPEELIRRAVSRLSSLHLAPDRKAAMNLKNVRGRVVDTQGNSLRDALAVALARYGELPKSGGNGGYGVVSMHRNENLRRRDDFALLMEEIVRASRHVTLYFVLHPATRARIVATGWLAKLQKSPGLTLVDRMDYPDFVRLLIASSFLMTDGGSNQEEASMLGLPTLLLRRVTERADGLGDVVELSGLNREMIRTHVTRFAHREWPLRLTCGTSPSRLIVDALEDFASPMIQRP